MSGTKDNDLRGLLWIALLLRIGTVGGISLFRLDDAFAPDHQTYHFFSAWLARYWSGDTETYPWKLLEASPRNYYYIVGALYYLLGPSELWPRLLNCVIGAAAVWATFNVAWLVSGSGAAARRAAVYVAFFPSLVLWSALNIRDCWVVLLVTLAARESLLLSQRVSGPPAIRLSLLLLALVGFRDYLLFPIAVPFVLTLLALRAQHFARTLTVGSVLLAGLIIADQFAGPERRLRLVSLEELQEVRQGTAVGASRFDPTADISTPGRALLFLPRGLGFFLLAPFPWTVRNFRQALTVPEMLFFYALLPSIVRGTIHLLRMRLAQSVGLLLMTGALTFGYALGQANAGTAYRHRAQVLPFYLTLSAIGSAWVTRRGRSLL